MKKNKTYKRFDSDTYRRVMSILIYLESIEVKDIVRHVNNIEVYYRVRVDSLRTLSVIVDNSCDKKEGEKMKVVHTKGTELVRSSDAKNLMLAKDLAIEFIDNGYDVIMRDGEDLVVYSSTDNSLQEYVPKSLQNIFYDVDKLDLLPLTYYVYMCK